MSEVNHHTCNKGPIQNQKSFCAECEADRKQNQAMDFLREKAGTEWIRKADAQELVDIWRKYAGLRPRTGRTAMVGQCADELAEVIARPSPDEEVVSADEWVRRCKAQNDAEARPVPQPATPNEELDKLRAKAARKSGDVIWLEGVLRKYGRHLSTCVKDKTYDVPCSCAWDNLALSINLPSPVIGVPQPATEPTKEFVPSNFCNRHSDCAAAVENFKRNNSGKTPGFNFHCHDEDCEDCFGC